MLEVGLCVAKCIRTDDEVLVGVERPAGADHVIDLVMVQSEAMHEKDRVVLCGIELAVRHIRHPEVRNYPAALQRKFAEICDLVRRLVRPMGRSQGAIRQRQHRHGDDTYHDSFRNSLEESTNHASQPHDISLVYGAHAFNSILSSLRKRQSVP
jgi:hypothetical protein